MCRLRYKRRGKHRLLQRKIRTVVFEQIVAGMQNTHNIIRGIRINGNTGISLFLDVFHDLFFARIDREQDQCTTGSHHILRGHTIEFEYIFYVLNVILFQRSLISTRIQHQDNVFLGYRLFFFMRINAEQTQYAIGRNRQQPNDGTQKHCQSGNDSTDHFGKLFLVLHGNAFGYQFTQNKREK